MTDNGSVESATGGNCCDACGWESSWGDAEYYSFVGYDDNLITLCGCCRFDHEEVLRLFSAQPHIGCCLHVLVDDGNIGDDTADFCLRWAEDRGHSFCFLVAEIIRSMSVTDRFRRWGNGRD